MGHRGTPELKYWQPHLGTIHEIWRTVVGGYETSGPHSMFRGTEPQLYMKQRALHKKRDFPVDRGDVAKERKETAYEKRKRSEFRKELSKRSIFRKVLSWSRKRE